MQKLSNPIPGARLRIHAKLCAISSNVTRWSSTAHMLKRYIELREILPKIDDDEIEKLFPTVSEYRRIEKLIQNLKSSIPSHSPCRKKTLQLRMPGVYLKL